MIACDIYRLGPRGFSFAIVLNSPSAPRGRALVFLSNPLNYDHAYPIIIKGLFASRPQFFLY